MTLYLQGGKVQPHSKTNSPSHCSEWMFLCNSFQAIVSICLTF